MKPLGPEWIHCDINDAFTKLGTFDLVTHFWYGYVHQLTLDDVRKTLLSLAEITAENGFLLLGVCDPITWSKSVSHENTVPFENNLFIDSIIWSYEDPFTNTKYKDCIAPHPALIWKWLEPYFEKIQMVHYPKSEAAPNWERYGYICSLRNNKEVDFDGEE